MGSELTPAALKDLSAIPCGWTKARLADVATVFDCPHSTPQLTNVGPYLARTQDIRTGVLLVESMACVSEETYADRIRRAVPEVGDLLYSREGTYFGVAAEVPLGIRLCLGQRMVQLRPDKRVLNHLFLKYWLNSPTMASHISGLRDGSVAERLNMSTIRALPIAFPTLADQDWISTALYALDNRIELLRKTNTTLEAIAEALFKSWFVDFDPVRAKVDGLTPAGMDTDTIALFPNAFQESERGLIPMGWGIDQLGEIAEVIDCLHAKKPELLVEGRPYLQLNCIRDDGLLSVDAAAKISDADYAKWISRIEAREGDCVVTNVGRVGAVAQVPAGFRAAIGRNMTALRGKAEFASPTFLIELLQSASMRAEIVHKTDAGTILNALNVKSIPGLRFVRPSTDLMKRFEETARPLRAAMEANLSRMDTLSRTRDTLLPRLISGKLRLPEAEALIEDAVA